MGASAGAGAGVLAVVGAGVLVCVLLVVVLVRLRLRRGARAVAVWVRFRVHPCHRMGGPHSARPPPAHRVPTRAAQRCLMPPIAAACQCPAAACVCVCGVVVDHRLFVRALQAE